MKWLVAILIIIGLLIFTFFDPYQVAWFPKCPFRTLTGLECPGCGAQRALHYIFNLEISKAFKENALLVCSIPYVITGFVFDNIKHPNAKVQIWQKRLFGLRAIYIVVIVIMVFWIGRNIIDFWMK